MVVPQGTSCTAGMDAVAQGREQRRAHRGQRHHGGQRVAGQPQDEPPVRQFGQDGGVAGTHGDPVDDQPPAQFGHGPAEVVGAGPAGTAGGDDDVGRQDGATPAPPGSATSSRAASHSS